MVGREGPAWLTAGTDCAADVCRYGRLYQRYTGKTTRPGNTEPLNTLVIKYI